MPSTSRTSILGSIAAVSAGAMMVSAAGLGSVAAQDVNGIALRGYPVAIHQGTCETLVAEPAFDLGFMSPRPLVAGADDGAVGAGAVEGPYANDDFYADGDATELSEDTAFLAEDVDGDGVLDYGLDRDADGTLTDAERLERPILWVAEANLGDLEGDAAGGEEADLADLRDTPHAIVIHHGSVADADYLGCAEIAGAVDDEGEMSVAMMPIGQDGFAGVVWFAEGDDGFLGIGGSGGELEVNAFPSSAIGSSSGGMGAQNNDMHDVEATPATS